MKKNILILVKHLQITREPNYGEIQEITEFVGIELFKNCIV